MSSPGQCFAAQQKLQAEIATLDAIPCDGPHRQEAYAIVAYQPPAGVAGRCFPGRRDLKSYADAKCAEQFQSYVGISYLDSSLFFTYLLPSARGWEQYERSLGGLLHHHHRSRAHVLGQGVQL